MLVQHERKDQWTTEDDNILAETVLRHIRSGSTQLKGFEETAKQLNRTASACGFRWNASVRKLYEDEIKAAKLSKNHRGKKPAVSHNPPIAEKKLEQDVQDSITEPLDNVLGIVNRFKLTVANMSKEIERLREHLRQKEQEIERLNTLLVRDRPVEVLSEDYQSFLKILENARKLQVL
ncbi:RsfA family transcriptional regulator [Paenibacillus thermotolerans]|uniref:RsfA family transcriptional regulator n=1 Tax=Paenibacillus thermotolerans TaxID=3027807 RepID=UPI00236855DF|nr:MULTISPECIES: RsfA family transcriptional regulator [unclassified Paenibacillus]